MKSTKRQNLATELESVRKSNGGLLRPPDVVEFARQNPESALHSQFEWDDSKAAEAHRLWQARQVIAVVVVSNDQADRNVRAYVSVPGDRRRVGGGYRPVEEALSDRSMREAVIDEVETNIRRLRERCDGFQDLAAILRRTESEVASLRRKPAASNTQGDAAHAAA